MAAFDLVNKFFHVKLRPDAYKYFRFSEPDENGTDNYYCFMVLAYSFTSPVATVTRLIKPITGYLHRKGIRIATCVDDGQVAGRNKVSAEQDFCFMFLVFQLTGWNVQWKKKAQQATCISAAEAAGWDCKIVWQVESLKELKWKQENLERFNRMYRDKSRGFEKIGAERPEVLGDRS
jgi:hypothetical protein